MAHDVEHLAAAAGAPGFRVTARSKDGIVEAGEKPGDDSVFGVQFHPEKFACKEGETTFTAIFKWLVDKASKRR